LRRAASRGFGHKEAIKRERDGEVEFQTLMWFDSLDAVRVFAGDN
jgi:hypothetical protein